MVPRQSAWRPALEAPPRDSTSRRSLRRRRIDRGADEGGIAVRRQVERIAVTRPREDGAPRHLAATVLDVEVIVADLGTPVGVDEVLTRTRGIDVGLYIAAAGYGTTGSFIESDLDSELTMIDVNCRAVVSLTHGFARRFADRGAGGIVLFGSLVGFQGVPQTANYAATKSFVQSFAEGLRLELKCLGVDVLATAPGPTHSGFAAQAAMTMSSAADADVVARSTLRSLGRRSSTVRPGVQAKLLGYSLIMLPRWARVRVLGSIMSGMSSATRQPTCLFRGQNTRILRFGQLRRSA